MKKRPAPGALTVKLRGAIGVGIKLLLTVFAAAVAGTIAGKQLRNDALGWIVAAVALLAGMAFTWQTAAGRIVVGDDGVRLTRAPKSRFLPYADLRAVRRLQQLAYQGRSNQPDVYIPAVHIVLASGEVIEVPMVSVPDETVSAVVSRIEAGIASASAASARPTLDRNGRSVTAWRDALAKQVQSADFRGKARTVEELDAVLTDPTSRAEDRVGAALALRATGAEGAAERIRVAASTSANARLRVALDAAAEDALDNEMLDAVAEVEGATR